MTDPTRLVDSGDPAVRRLLQSADSDRPDPTAARATLVALGLTAPAVMAAAAAAAPGTTAAAAVAKGTLGTLLGTLTAKVAIAVTAAAVASAVVVVATHPRPVSTLAEESALLRTAADALEAQRPTAALDALRTHDARFPNPALAEEADALRIEALQASGDRAAARAALDRFHARYPESPFAPVINSPPAGDESLQAEQGDSK